MTLVRLFLVDRLIYIFKFSFLKLVDSLMIIVIIACALLLNYHAVHVDGQ